MKLPRGVLCHAVFLSVRALRSRSEGHGVEGGGDGGNSHGDGAIGARATSFVFGELDCLLVSELDWLEVVNDSSEDGCDESRLGVTGIFEVSEEAHDLLVGAGLVEGELHILSGAVGGEVSVEVDVDLLAHDDLASIIRCIKFLCAFLAALIEDRNPGLLRDLVQDAVVSGHVGEAADGSLGRVEIAGQEGGGVDGVG